MLDWWCSELAAMMPSLARRAVGLDQDELLVSLSEGRLEVRRGDSRLASCDWGDKEQADPVAALRDKLAPIDARSVRLVLALDPGLTLRRSLQVPRAAEAEIRGVLAFEIERHTPFRDQEIYFNHMIDRAASNDTAMAVDLVILPRRMVDPLIHGLGALGFDLERVVVGDSGDQAVTIPVSGLARRRRGGNKAVKLWAALTIVLAIAAATAPLMRLQSVGETLAAAVEQARTEAQATSALQDEVDRLSRGAKVIADARAETSSPLAILQALSGLLPDGTWIVQLSLVGDELVLEGRTESSARLVGLLEASPLIESVTYLAPITRDGDQSVERFNFSLRLARG